MATPWHGRFRRTCASDRAVQTAEQVVRRAWVSELRRRQDLLDLVVQASFEDCALAAARLAAAQRDGDPGKIGTARAAARLAVDGARAAMTARDQGRRTLRARSRRLRHGVPAPWSPPPVAPDPALLNPRPGRSQPTLPAARPQGRLRPWRRGLSSRFQ